MVSVIEPRSAILTIDLESWLVSSRDLFRCTKGTSIDVAESVVPNTRWLLRLLRELDIRATFFVLGEVAQAFPSLIVEVANEGHEIGNHCFTHDLLFEKSESEIERSILETHKILTRILGMDSKIVSFRAPYFSVTPAIRENVDRVLDALGYQIDSSESPVRSLLPGECPREDVRKVGGIWRIPVSTLPVRLLGKTFRLPVGGGGYYRILPLPIIRVALGSMLRRSLTPVVLYFHPYEIDKGDRNLPDSCSGLSARERLRYSLQLAGRGGMKRKIKESLGLLRDRGMTFTTMKEYCDKLISGRDDNRDWTT